jgi:uncharacterized protein YyaL (SSP411 family)
MDNATWLHAAQEAFHFITDAMQQDGRLAHSWCDGRNTSDGLSTDYAQMTHAALMLHSATGSSGYLDRAIAWFDHANSDYIDSGVVYLTPAHRVGLIVRPTASTDEATPSAAGILLQDAARLFMLTGETRFRNTARNILSAHAAQTARDIVGTASLQSGFDSLLRARLAYICADKPDDAINLAEWVLAEADPALVLLRDPNDGTPPPKPVTISGDNASAIYLCETDRCRPPVSDRDTANALLAETRTGRAPGKP